MPFQIIVPELGESVVEATVGQWLKKEGDRVKVGEPIVELETDKVNLEVGAEKDGVLTKIARKKGEDVKIGDVLGLIDETAESGVYPVVSEAPAAATPPPTTKQRATQVISETAPPRPSTERVTPVARRIAEEHGVDPSKVPASGDRVTKSDVQRFLGEQAAQPEAALKPVAPPQVVPVEPSSAVARNRADREERVRMSRRRRTIAQRLVEAQHTAAMLTTFNEVDMGAIMDLREKRKVAFKEKYGISLGIASFFVKASIGALKEYPRLNAEIDGEDIILKHYYDIGVAIGSDEGLVVPVLRDADRMSFADIEKDIKRFAQQAEDGTLALNDLRGGTFTITNGGVFGSMLSTPILNMPQVGILGLHKIEQRPVVANGQIVIRPMMYIALSYDHRIVDGSESVRFLVRVKEMIEDPTTMLLEG